MLFASFEQLVIILQATFVFLDPLFDELTALDLFQYLLHFGLGLLIHNARAAW